MQGAITSIVLIVCAIVGALSLAVSAVAIVVVAWAVRSAARQGRAALDWVAGSAQEATRVPGESRRASWAELLRGH